MAEERDELVRAPCEYSSRPSDELVRPDTVMVGSPIISNGDLDDYSSSTEEYATDAESPDDEDVEPGSFMDRRMFMQATQGQVDDFKKVLDEISMEKELQRSEIFRQVSPQRNTCLHIAASSGHFHLACNIVKECPQLIKMKNSRGDTALHIAARRNDSITFVNLVIHSCHSGSAVSWDIEKAESLLRIVNQEENTVLHEALIHHCKEVAKVLIKADPQAAYCPNEEGKTPLYLAAEAQYLDVVEIMEKEKPTTEERQSKVKPAIYGAILGRNKEMLGNILAMEAGHQTNEDERTTPLHCAASIGYLEGVQTLLRQSNFDRYQRDNEGLYPIHVASKRGYVAIVKELLRFSPDSKELLIKHGENILHVAAKCGKDNVVNFVLKEKGIEKLINEKNSYGNTPLHLATMHGHPKVVSSLTWDKRVDVNLVNKKGQTALDIASVGHPLTFHQRLIWIALKSADAQPARESKVPPSRSVGAHPPRESTIPPSGSAGAQPPRTEKFKDSVNTLLLVSTLVATVTFAAGFTMPGGYNSSGMANMLTRNIFHVFVICDTIAMYSSILAVVTLIWAQLDDLCLMHTAVIWALPFLCLAVTAMSLAFMAGVYLVVSNLHWLAIVVLIIGIIGLVSLLVPFLLLFLPSESTNCILRYVSYYSFPILIRASSPKTKRKD